MRPYWLLIKAIMEIDTALAFTLISKITEGKFDNEAVEKATRTISSHAEEFGLTDQQLLMIANVICNEKIGSSITSSLLKCLIPELKVPNSVLLKILSWTFTKIGTLGTSVERLLFRWIADLLKFNLCDKNTVQKYYYSFLYALSEYRHLEVNACMVLCYLSQKEDAKPFIVKPLIARYQRGTFSQLNSLLAILKGFQDKVVPINLGNWPLNRPHSQFETGMSNAEERVESNGMVCGRRSSLRVRAFRPQRTEWARKPRLIPAVEYAKTRSSFVLKYPATVPGPAIELGLTAPAQIMSLLANEGGFLTLLAADPSQQVRLLYNLDETLNKVLLLESESYSDGEKIFLLVSMAALQEYLNSSLTIVSNFLIKYLLLWDGEEYSNHIHSLIEWLTFSTIEDWEIVASVLRVLFRSYDKDEACRMLYSLKIMLRNMIATNRAQRADVAPPLCEDVNDNVDLNRLYMAIGNLIGEVLTEKICHDRGTDDVILVSHALYFYQEAIGMETEGDLCALLMIPPTIVYHVLLTNHRSNIHHLCLLLLSYDSLSRERLHRLGVFEDFESQLIGYLGTFLMDLYRALFSNLEFMSDLNPGVFTPEFLQRTAQLNPQKAFDFKAPENTTWWSPYASSSNYPNIKSIKKFIESKLASLQQP